MDGREVYFYDVVPLNCTVSFYFVHVASRSTNLSILTETLSAGAMPLCNRTIGPFSLQENRISSLVDGDCVCVH